MTSNNGQRLNIWLQMKDKFNYSEFKELCAAENITALSGLEFAQKAGMIICGTSTYPDLPVLDAYVKFVQESSILDIKIAENNAVIDANCDTCGGGVLV